MKKYSSNYPQRNAFNEALYETVEEFLQEIDIRPSDTVLAVNSKHWKPFWAQNPNLQQAGKLIR